jgi:hypothetical protein
VLLACATAAACCAPSGRAPDTRHGNASASAPCGRSTHAGIEARQRVALLRARRAVATWAHQALTWLARDGTRAELSFVGIDHRRAGRNAQAGGSDSKQSGARRSSSAAKHEAADAGIALPPRKRCSRSRFVHCSRQREVKKSAKQIARDRLCDRQCRDSMTRSRYLPIALTSENNSVIAEPELNVARSRRGQNL